MDQVTISKSDYDRLLKAADQLGELFDYTHTLDCNLSFKECSVEGCKAFTLETGRYTSCHHCERMTQCEADPDLDVCDAHIEEHRRKCAVCSDCFRAEVKVLTD